MIVAVSIVAGSMVAYGLQQQIISVLLRPSHGQQFIYTSPLGGINFLFSVCLDIGIALSIPLIIYHVLRFLQPLMRETTRRFIAIGSLISGTVAMIGILFGYFIGLPAALHFLLHQFTSAQVRPLVTIQSYMSFVTVYLLGCALMFQLPLLLIFINRIKPLKPSRLFHYERHVIVSALIVGFIMNPSPNLIDQMFVVAPIIVMYQVGILLIWYINRGGKNAKYRHLLEEDLQLQAERMQRALHLEPLVEPEPIAITPSGKEIPVSRPAYDAAIRPRLRADYQVPTRRVMAIKRIS